MIDAVGRIVCKECDHDMRLVGSRKIDGGKTIIFQCDRCTSTTVFAPKLAFEQDYLTTGE